MTEPPVAAVDIGSNTVKITVAAVHSRSAAGTPESVDVLAEDARVTRLSAHLTPGGRLHPEAVERTLAALRDFVALARRHGATRIRAVATAGLRRAADPEVFVRRADREIGLEVEVIDGQREAALAFAGATAGAGRAGRAAIVVDIGGRSTEVAAGFGATVEASVSLDIGTLTLTEDALPSDPPTSDELAAARAVARAALEAAPPARTEAEVVGVSGTVLSLAGRHRGIASMSELIRRAEEAPLTREAIEVQIEELAALTAAERVLGDVLPEGRADVIVAGAILLSAVLERYGKERLLVTPRGLRYALL